MLSFRSFNHFTLISLALWGLTVSSVNAATLLENPPGLSGDRGSCSFDSTCSDTNWFDATEFSLGSSYTIDALSLAAIARDHPANEITQINWNIFFDGLRTWEVRLRQDQVALTLLVLPGQKTGC